MQTSSSEARVLYPSLNAAQSAAFFLPADLSIDPLPSFGYGFKLSDTGHWQSSNNIDINQSANYDPM